MHKYATKHIINVGNVLIDFTQILVYTERIRKSVQNEKNV